MWIIYQIDAPETRGRVMHFLNEIGARDTKTLQPDSPKDAVAHSGFAPVSPDTRQNELINVANQVFDRCP